MKKAIVLTLLAILIVATPVIAAPPTHSNANKETPGKIKSEERKTKNKEAENVEEEQEVVVGSISIESEVEENEDETEGSGEVRGLQTSIADEECPPDAEWKNHGKYVSCVAKLGLGGKVVSEAAKSDIGKKEKDNDATPSATPTPTNGPITSPISTVESSLSPIQDLLEDVVSFVRNLL